MPLRDPGSAPSCRVEVALHRLEMRGWNRDRGVVFRERLQCRGGDALPVPSLPQRVAQPAQMFPGT